MSYTSEDWSIGMRQLNIDKVLAMLKERDALITELADTLEDAIKYRADFFIYDDLIKRAREHTA